MKRNSLFFGLAVISMFLTFCRSQENSGDQLDLCTEFYSLNKNQDFEELKGIIVESRSSEYKGDDDKIVVNYSTVSFYDSLKKEYVKVPLYEANAPDDLKVKCGNSCIEYLKKRYRSDEEFDLDNSLRNLNDELNNELKKIKIPESYKYSNVIKIVGKPFKGTIEFYLSDKQSLVLKWNANIETQIDGDHLGNGWFCVEAQN